MRALLDAKRVAAPPRPSVLPPAVDPNGYRPVERPAPPADDAPPGWRPPVRGRRPFWSELWRWLLVAILFAAGTAAVVGGGLLLGVYWQARSDQARPVDAIVVLGTAQWNGLPGPVLRARLDHALGLYREGLASTIVVTGGRAPGDEFTEAEAGREYLLGQGVPDGAILLENEGRDTWESLRGVSALLTDWPSKRILLVSDGFHLLRAKLMARDLGLTPFASAASDSPIRPGGPGELSYAVREVAGILAHLWTRR